MSKWIDADALHDALKAKQKWVVRCGDKHNEGYTYDQVHFAIDDAPSIDIEPKRGEWIEDEEDWRHQIVFWRCSECGYAVSTMYNFCPNCGARMKGADDE